VHAVTPRDHPYEQWRKHGLFQTPKPPTIPTILAIPAILKDSHTARDQFGIDQPVGDAAAIVFRVLTDRLGIGPGTSHLDQLDEGAAPPAAAGTGI
jgi:hypothetical protein